MFFAETSIRGRSQRTVYVFSRTSERRGEPRSFETLFNTARRKTRERGKSRTTGLCQRLFQRGLVL